jgi:hypothetical protein
MFYLKAKGAEPFTILHTVLSHIYILCNIGAFFRNRLSWQGIFLKCYIKPCMDHAQTHSAKAFIPVSQAIL